MGDYTFNGWAYFTAYNERTGKNEAVGGHYGCISPAEVEAVFRRVKGEGNALMLARLYFHLAAYRRGCSDCTCRARRSYREAGRYLGCSAKTARAHALKLAELGLVEIEGGSKNGSPSVFRFLLIDRLRDEGEQGILGGGGIPSSVSPSYGDGKHLDEETKETPSDYSSYGEGKHPVTSPRAPSPRDIGLVELLEGNGYEGEGVPYPRSVCAFCGSLNVRIESDGYGTCRDCGALVY